MIIDMHMHEKTFSRDSKLSLEEIVNTAIEKGLEGVCITDHDSMGIYEYAKWYEKKRNFPIFVGVEYYSLEGDILAFGLDEVPNKRISAQAFINQVKEQGGITISAHPFRHNNRGLKEQVEVVTGLDAIEVLNGSTYLKDNQRAFCSARDCNLKTIGASDCHQLDKIGVYASYFPRQIRNEKELVEVFKKEEITPVIYTKGKYNPVYNLGLPQDKRMIECIYK